MPRHPDPDLEDRILKAAQTLWHRGGEKSLTLRAVARAARTNTPAVYRRFRNREDMIRAMLRRIIARIGQQFEASASLEEMAEAYIDFALREPHEYDLFYTHARTLLPPGAQTNPRPIREYRPNFGLVERKLAERFGGAPEDHTQLAMALWAMLHGATMLLLSKAATGHEEELRAAMRAAIGNLLAGEKRFRKDGRGVGKEET
jgi:AcrR family transcriptional regulator